MKRFRTLKADEVDARVGTCNQNGFSLLLYKDARCDQNILDEAVGPENWQRRHYEVKGNMFCSVGIYDDAKKDWIWKDDCGTESNTEKEKGEASDSFKRACFNWGIGRELYTTPFIYIKGRTEQKNNKYVPSFRNFKVLIFECQDSKISKLQISGDGEVIYEFTFARVWRCNSASGQRSKLCLKKERTPMRLSSSQTSIYQHNIRKTIRYACISLF